MFFISKIVVTDWPNDKRTVLLPEFWQTSDEVVTKDMVSLLCLLQSHLHPPSSLGSMGGEGSPHLGATVPAVTFLCTPYMGSGEEGAASNQTHWNLIGSDWTPYHPRHCRQENGRRVTCWVISTYFWSRGSGRSKSPKESQGLLPQGEETWDPCVLWFNKCNKGNFLLPQKLLKAPCTNFSKITISPKCYYL